jgi:hypothetical protein
MDNSADAMLSKHAQRRGAQSNLCEHDVDLVRKYGVLERRTGVRFYFVRRREVERFRAIEPRLAKLDGIVMVMSPDGIVITFYRNSKAQRSIRRKHKFGDKRAA